MTEETRIRFLAAIAKQIPAHRVIEAHLFPAIRQGGVESGVAVLALEREIFPSLEVTSVEIPIASVDPESVPSLADTSVEIPTDVSRISDVSTTDSDAAAESTADVPASRYTVYSARYRYTLKGPDRGKWEVSVTDEADAPLLTIDAVVRGVQRRSGEEDDTVRLSGDEFRAALPAPPTG